ncbi:hypothetical protein L7F22_015778 [Adiantum nelumboides]|nr:hypothetical protein [Adiantum nelumboides]
MVLSCRALLAPPFASSLLPPLSLTTTTTRACGRLSPCSGGIGVLHSRPGRVLQVRAARVESRSLPLASRAPEFELPEPLTGKTWKLDDFEGYKDASKALSFIQQFDIAFVGGRYSEHSKILRAASYFKGNARTWWSTLLLNKTALVKWLKFKKLFISSWLTQEYERDIRQGCFRTDIMPRRPNPLWAEHTNVLRVVNTSRQAGSGTRTWVCKYCGEQMTSTITRVLKHLTGIGTTGHCGGCEAVPPALRDALILEHFPPGSTASSQSGGARAAAIAAEDALQDALLGDIGGSASALPSFAGTSRKRARVSQAEDEGASASAASTGDVPDDGEPNEQPEVEENEKILVPEQILAHKDTKNKGVIENDYNAFKSGVMFICNHCPFVVHLKMELVKLANDYLPKGVGIVAISANSIKTHPQDGPDIMAREAEELGYPFPYLYDETQETARAYCATCTPDFFLYKKDGRRPFELVYHGQFDDSRPANNRPTTGRDLRSALDCLLSGLSVSPVQKPSIGCSIKWHPK